MKNSKTILMLSAAGLFLLQGLSLAERIEGRVTRVGPGNSVTVTRNGSGAGAYQQINVRLKSSAVAQNLKEGDSVTLEATQNKSSNQWEASSIRKTGGSMSGTTPRPSMDITGAPGTGSRNNTSTYGNASVRTY